MEILIDAQTIITGAAVLTALGTIIAAVLKTHSWYLKVEKRDSDIKALDVKIDSRTEALETKFDSAVKLLEAKHDSDMDDSKEERQLVCYALLACLDGLQQLGCNSSVSEAHNMLEKHLNKKAHK